LFPRDVEAEDKGQKNVLILNSYGNELSILSGYESKEWTDEIIDSINSQFVMSKENINVKMEYMSLEGESWPQYYELYKYNFSDTKFDVIISLDDNAFYFLQKYGDKLFPNTPVVFSGVNNFDKSMIADKPLFTGLKKSEDIKNTIEIALKLQPNTKEVFIIMDKTRAEAKNIKELIFRYKGRVNFIFCYEQNITKVKEKISKLSNDTIIYFDTGIKDNNGNDMLFSEATDNLFKEIDNPVFSRLYIELNKYSVGGVVTNGTDLGKEVGKLALRILGGEKPYNIPVVEDSSHNYVFNYEKLKEFCIDLKALPEGSQVVNQPSKSYVISKKLILYVTAIVTFIFVIGLILIKFNIRKRKFVERLLSDSENLLSTLINSTPNIVYFKSPEGKFLEINSAALNLLGINEEEYKNILELSYTPTKQESLLTEWESKDEEVWKTGNIYRCEEIILCEKDNVYKVYDTLRIPLYNDDGTHQGLIFLGINITEHKINEQNEQRIKELMYYDELRTNFFSNISHELKTPLNLIFSALQVTELKINLIDENQKNIKKYINIIRQNCYRLLRIINNLIDITKLDAGHFVINYSNKDIVGVIENIVLSIVDYVESKGISITFDTQIEEKIMTFDPDAMERIILNLLSNSIKFTPNGGSIEVNIYDKVSSIVISVKDTGVGIPIQKQASIFEKFVQVDKSLSRNREGSGIGLSLVKELVALHGGTIELESTIGKGSEFIIEIPVRLEKQYNSANEIDMYTMEDRVERINIEFSDIYN
jgi:signal transduction histidine kinase/ABC-type uncharacterized transport system substrate-binding protein